MFKLTRRDSSAKWQVRKRWPSDVASVLKGEFTKSTGHEDKRLAQQQLPMISAEYERRVAEARAKVTAKPREELSVAEAHRMAADFYRTALPAYVVRRPISPVEQQRLLSDTRANLASAKRMLGRNEFGPIFAVARRMVGQAGVSLPDDDPALEQLHRLLMVAFIELHEAAVANLSGDVIRTPTISAVEAPTGRLQEPGRTVDALITAYETDKSPRWSDSTKTAVGPVFRFLREIYPDRDVTSITREDAREAVKLLEAMPTMLGRREQLRGLSLREAITKAKQLRLPTIKPKTINDGYLLHIASMFNWARKEQWVTFNPFEGLTIHDPVDDRDRRDPLTAAQLQALFSKAPWDAPWDPKGDKPGAYWVPLLCLFHGLRNAEGAALRVEDVGEDDGVPVLRIRPYGGKQLKTKESRGTLALHPELLRLGFLDHVKARQEAGEVLLFPEGAHISRKGQVAVGLSKWFSAHVKSLKFEGTLLGMHSFRHAFEDRLRAAELPERTALALARRSESGSSRIYGDGLSARQKAEAIAKIEYPGLELSHLRPATSRRKVNGGGKNAPNPERGA